MISQVGSAGLGFVFWILAAHAFTTSAVGVGSGLVSAMMLLGAVGMLGLGTLLVREFPDEPGREISMIAAAAWVAGAFGAVLGIGFALVAPRLSSDFAVLTASPMTVATFTVGVALFGIATIADEALIGLLQSGLILLRNLVAAGARLLVLAAVALLGRTSSVDIFSAWVIANALSLVVLLLIAAGTGRLSAVTRPAWGVMGRLRMSALQHHLLNLAIQVPGWVMPLIAVAMISAESNAAFYVVWMLIGLTAFIPSALMWGLYAEGTRDPERLWLHARQTLRWAGLAAMASIIGLWIVAPVVLSAFGTHYLDSGRAPLSIMALAVVPMVVKGHFVAAHRVHRTLTPAILAVSFGALLELVGAALGAARGELMGLSIGITAAMYVEIVVMVPTVVRLIRPAPALESSPPASRGASPDLRPPAR